MPSQYKTPSLDEMSAAYDAQQAAIPKVVEPAVQPIEQPATDGVTQKPFSAEQDQTPGFFGGLKDAYNRSSLAPGNNSFNAPNIFESIATGVLSRTAPKPNAQPKGFFGKLGSDAVAIGAGLPIALSHPIDTAKATFIGGTEDDSFLTRLKKGAIIESIGQVGDKQYYKDHPGLAALNTGSWIATVATLGLSKVLGTAIKVGITRGIEEAGIVGAERAAVSVALEQTTKSGAFRMAIKEAVKSGDTVIVSEVAKQALIKQGVAEEAAIQISSKIAEGMGGHLAESAGKVKVLNSAAHPFTTLSDTAGVVLDPLKKLVFGETPNSAVGRLYGAEVVAKNPKGFLDIEKWASQQAVERGLKDTVANRETIMTDWSKTVSEWSVLSPEERVAYHQNYVRASEMAQQVARVTGDTVVPTKFLAPQYVDAMKQTVAAAPESMSAMGILDELQSVYGNDIKLHRKSLERLLRETGSEPLSRVAREEVRIPKSLAQADEINTEMFARFGGEAVEETVMIGKKEVKYFRPPDSVLGGAPVIHTERDALMAGIEALGNRETLSYNSLPEVSALVKELEQTTGYRLVEAPRGKPISYATKEARVTADTAALAGAEAIPEVSQLTKMKTKLGQLIDRLGLNPTGGNEGSLEFLYQDNFNQAAAKELGSKYGGTFTVDHQTIPFTKLYDYLNAKKAIIFERAGIKGRLFNTSTGVLDMTVDDLVTHGFQKPLAEDIVRMSKTALTDIPFEKTGLADGIANLARARIPGYAKFMKVAMNGRFNLNPFYGMQAWFELEFNKAAGLGDIRSAIKSVSFGERTDNLINKVLEKIPYLKDTINPELNYSEIKLVQDELMDSVQQNSLSAASNPEMATLKRAAEMGGTPAETQAFAKSIQSNNLMFNALGYTTQRGVTGFAKALAEKFGFSLEEALSSKMVNGSKVYNNPEMFNMLREATSDLAGYKPGFLTSPLAKTMNVIWFPFRFQAKTVAGVAEFVGNLPPLTRVGVMSDWTHFAKYAESPEGKKWRAENSHTWYNTLNYVFTWESSGRAISDVLDGKLFGGNTGQLGGMPFGFITNLMQNLGITADQPQTGSKGYSKRIPKELMSSATAVVVIESLFSHVFPKMPFYTLFNGNVSSLETNIKKNVIEGVFANVLDKASGGTGIGAKSKFQRTQFKNLRPGDTRF